MDNVELVTAMSLRDREWPFRLGGRCDSSLVLSPVRLRYQLLGSEDSASGSDKLR